MFESIMTFPTEASVDPRPVLGRQSREPLLHRLTAAHAVLDADHSCDDDLSSLDDDDLLTALAAARDTSRAVEVALSRLAAEVESRSAHALGQNGLAARQGAVNGAALVRRVTGSTLTEAFRRIRSGGLLEPQSEASSASPFAGLSRALSAGAIDAGGAVAVLRILEPVVSDVPPAVLAAAVDGLAASAGVLDADDLAHRARSLRDTLDRAGVADREARLWERRSLRFGRPVDGMLPVHGLLPPESAALVKGVLDQAMSPKLGGPRFVDADRREAAERVEADPRTLEQFRHDVLIEAISPSTSVEGRVLSGSQPAVTVLVSLSDLAGVSRPPLGDVVETGEASRAGRRDRGGSDGSNSSNSSDSSDSSGGSESGDGGGSPSDSPSDSRSDGSGIAWLAGSDEPVSAETARRILCDAGFTAVLVDGAGDPLRVGDSRRLFTRRQRRALDVRDGGCLFPGCDRPPTWAEAHHIRPWSRGGPTYIDNGVLLCRHHHRLVHHHGWDIEPVESTGEPTPSSHRFAIRPPAAVDPQRRLIPMPSKTPRWLTT